MDITPIHPLRQKYLSPRFLRFLQQKRNGKTNPLELGNLPCTALLLGVLKPSAKGVARLMKQMDKTDDANNA